MPDPVSNNASNPAAIGGARSNRLYYWVWVIVKNILGWVFILAAPPIGLIAPGPMGLPLFLIGFAMITFPGKRRLTSRVLRGKPFDPNTPERIATEVLVALGLPSLAVWVLAIGFADQIHRHGQALVLTIYGLTVLAAWMVARLGMRAVNFGLTLVPPMRRKIRPWMRRKGINLLPPRRRDRLRRRGKTEVPEGEILEVDPRYEAGLKSFWQKAKPWLRKIISAALIIAIFIWMGKGVVHHWGEVKDRAKSISVVWFIVAAGMFAAFLFGVRALSWRRILAGFGNRLPGPAAVRIWSTSELARYIPGVIWQIAGRAYLALPYGVSKTVCAASQVLELIIFLLANISIGVTCLSVFGFRNVHGQARHWLMDLAAMVPVLMLILHPRIFYGIFDWILKLMGRPALAQRLSGRELSKLLMFQIVGLLWQSLAVFLIVAQPLGLHWSKWYVVTGAYSLAWCAGFIVPTPGGLGTRELVFVKTMEVALPGYVRNTFADAASLNAFLFFLGGLLRLWTIAGELLVWSIATAVDYAKPGYSTGRGIGVGVGDAAG